MIIGTLAGAGTLGLLIPPSIILIVYGVTVNESIASLFMAGVLPGIMLAFLFMAYIVLHALLRPEGMPPRGEVFGFVQKLRNSVYLLPVVLLIIAVLGSIYAGIARSEEHTSELQSLMRISYAVFCLKKKNIKKNNQVPM